MTTFQKALWRIAGLVPLGLYVVTISFILPLNYYSGTRERIGLTVWIVLFVLSILVLLSLQLWSIYCMGRAKGTTPSGWQGYVSLFHTEKKWFLLIPAFVVLLWIAAIVYYVQ